MLTPPGNGRKEKCWLSRFGECFMACTLLELNKNICESQKFYLYLCFSFYSCLIFHIVQNSLLYNSIVRVGKFKWIIHHKKKSKNVSWLHYTLLNELTTYEWLNHVRRRVMMVIRIMLGWFPSFPAIKSRYPHTSPYLNICVDI